MLPKNIPGLSPMDIKVVEILEHGHTIRNHGKFFELLVNAIAYADGENQERFRVGLPEVMAAFDRWKKGESGLIYDTYLRQRHLSIVEN